MENEECANHDAHFQEKLDALKDHVACLTILLKQALKNTYGEGPLTRLAAAAQTQAMNHLEEVIREGVKDPHLAFVQFLRCRGRTN